jgi:hypothetical protein
MTQRKAVVLGMTTLLLMSAIATAMDHHHEDRERILKIEQEWNEVYLKGDAAPLQRIIADDYLGTEPDGKRVTKEDLIAGVESSRLSDGKVNEDDLTIRYYGLTAVVNGSSTWRQSGGKSGRFIWTDIFVKRAGQWLVVASQDLEVDDGK